MWVGWLAQPVVNVDRVSVRLLTVTRMIPKAMWQEKYLDEKCHAKFGNIRMNLLICRCYLQIVRPFDASSFWIFSFVHLTCFPMWMNAKKTIFDSLIVFFFRYLLRFFDCFSSNVLTERDLDCRLDFLTFSNSTSEMSDA